MGVGVEVGVGVTVAVAATAVVAGVEAAVVAAAVVALAAAKPHTARGFKMNSGDIKANTCNRLTCVI